MNKLEELQQNYTKVSAEIARVRHEIQEEGEKANSTRKRISAIKQNIQEMTIQLKNVPKQRIGKKMSSTQIIESKKQLNEEMEQKQAELMALENGLFSSSSLGLSGLLQNELSSWGRELSYIKSEIIKAQLELLTKEIIDSANEPLKKMALFLLSTKKLQKEPDFVYQTLGLEICKGLFGEQNMSKAKLPSPIQVNQQVNELIGKSL